MTLHDLAERVAQASGPDRGIDGFIARDLLGWLPYFDLKGNRIAEWHEFAGHWHLPGDPCDGHHSVSEERNPDPPEYSASIDAALALVERLLPKWTIRLVWQPGLKEPEAFCELGGSGKTASAATLPLAILAALLRVLSALEGKQP